jgi:hypothetical protein
MPQIQDSGLLGSTVFQQGYAHSHWVHVVFIFLDLTFYDNWCGRTLLLWPPDSLGLNTEFIFHMGKCQKHFQTRSKDSSRFATITSKMLANTRQIFAPH